MSGTASSIQQGQEAYHCLYPSVSSAPSVGCCSFTVPPLL